MLHGHIDASIKENWDVRKKFKTKETIPAKIFEPSRKLSEIRQKTVL